MIIFTDVTDVSLALLQNINKISQGISHPSPVRAQIAVALVVFIKNPINHIFFECLIIPDYDFFPKQ